MQKPSLSYDVLFAALALGAASSVVACREAAKAEPTPASVAPPPASLAQPPPPPEPGATNAPQPSPPPSDAVDAGKEKQIAPPSRPVVAPKPVAPGASAACGASGCSPDMKKGN